MITPPCEVHEHDLNRYRAERDVAVLELKAEVARHHLTCVQIDEAKRKVEALVRCRALEEALVVIQDVIRDEKTLGDAHREVEKLVMDAQRKLTPR